MNKDLEYIYNMLTNKKVKKKELPKRIIINYKGKKQEIRSDKFKLNLLMPIHNIKNDSSYKYVKASEVKIACDNNKLPYDNLMNWLNGQTMPVIEEEKDEMFSCYFVHDIELWFGHMIYNRKEPINWD